jgi:hypothetical protein
MPDAMKCTGFSGRGLVPNLRCRGTSPGTAIAKVVTNCVLIDSVVSDSTTFYEESVTTAHLSSQTARSGDGCAEPLGHLAEQIRLIFTDPGHVAFPPRRQRSRQSWKPPFNKVAFRPAAPRSPAAHTPHLRAECPQPHRESHGRRGRSGA